MFAVGPKGAAKRVGDCVKSKYKCTMATLTQVGDELSFLKHRHMWIRDGVLGIFPNPKHIDKALRPTASCVSMFPCAMGSLLRVNWW